MQSRQLISLTALLFAALFAALAGCTEEEIPVILDEDAGVGDDADLSDVDHQDTSPDPSAQFCEPCTDDDQCGEGGLCLALLDGERSCGMACDLDGDDCPDGAYCAVVDDQDNTQCIPEDLTCAENCQGVSCPAGQYCDPTSGDCVAEARICDTGCQFDVQCGPPDEFRCLGTGAPDGETMCTTTCDPNVTGENSNLECPTDFFCVPLVEGADEGVCYPLMRTCIDRCHDVTCPAGHNCDPFTGGCVQAEAGACQACESDAHCEGQNDLCLNIGIGDGPHCWLDCTSDATCPEGYDCMAFLGLTTRLCVPPAQQCSQCDDADCFPDGICNPVSGECMPHPEDCTVEGCQDDQLCDPLSKRCVEYDRSCSGDSWAVDCDNVITRCTTQRSGTAGVCATLCFDDQDCPSDQSCTSTIYGDLCLGEDLGGAGSCGIISESGALIGQPCGDGAGSCSGSTFCVEGGGVPGFCSQSCEGNLTCPDGTTCGLGPDGDAVCLPAQCRCAGSPGMSGELSDGWESALAELDLSACDLIIDPALLDSVLQLEGQVLRSELLEVIVTNPVAAQGILRSLVADLDTAHDDPADLIVASAQAAGFEVAPPQITDDAAPLEDALAALAATAGGSVDPGEVADAIADVPQEVRDLAARLVSAIDQAYAARQTALADAGLDEPTLQLLFDQTHRLVLPSAPGQEALDLSDPDLVDALENFPVAALAQIAADLTATVVDAIDEAALDPSQIGDSFLAVVDTPAGAIVIGDAADRVYDPADIAGLDGPTALVLAIGGDNTYKIPVGANQSLANAISLAVDLDGHDTYTYEKVGDSLDGDSLLVSDEAGRRAPDADFGAVSLSETARQGVGRLGIGLIFNRGNGNNTYETLRLGQGAGVLGVGALFDQGSGNSIFEAEAFAQGAALYGLGLLASADGDNTYRLWHAGQGFGTASGAGVLYDRQGHDQYLAVTGLTDSTQILYPSSSDGGNANRNLAQGVGSGAGDLAGGLGILRDFDGNDTYDAASFVQGFGHTVGVGLLADAGGDDHYQGRSYIQGAGLDGGAGLLLDTGGDDVFNQDAIPNQLGQGAANTLAWGAMIVEGGVNDVRFSLPGGGVGIDGAMGFALFDGGPNVHDNIGGGLGLSSFNPGPTSPLATAWTLGVFVQTGAQQDSYNHPVDGLGVEDDSIWRQDDDDIDRALGVGVDQ